jgi:hypothetical protein
MPFGLQRDFADQSGRVRTEISIWRFHRFDSPMMKYGKTKSRWRLFIR